MSLRDAIQEGEDPACQEESPRHPHAKRVPSTGGYFGLTDELRAESTSFMQRVFRGASKPLLVHFAQEAQLTPTAVRELKRLLDQSLKKSP